MTDRHLWPCHIAEHRCIQSAARIAIHGQTNKGVAGHGNGLR